MDQVINYSITDAAITQLAGKYENHTDASTPEKYKAVENGLKEIRKLRTGVDKHRKELGKDALEWGRRVNAEAKRITGKLEKIEEPMKRAKAEADEMEAARLREKEEREKIRREKIIARIEIFKNAHLVTRTMSSEDWNIIENDIINIEVDESFEEFQPIAQKEKDAALSRIGDLAQLASANEKKERDLKEQEERIAEEKRILAEQEAEREEKAAKEKQIQDQKNAEFAERERVIAEKEKALEEKDKPVDMDQGFPDESGEIPVDSDGSINMKSVPISNDSVTLNSEIAPDSPTGGLQASKMTEETVSECDYNPKPILLGFPILVPANAEFQEAPQKIEFFTKHYVYTIPIGKDHTAELIIDEDALNYWNENPEIIN